MLTSRGNGEGERPRPAAESIWNILHIHAGKRNALPGIDPASGRFRVRATALRRSGSCK
jgi:hypothetical protein